ncbi:metallophosphoesterase 1-like isoform X2 [Penaeus chinensis]|uniref:metallophosphoesterase 1-like isoform X2 n=1 Tax=Penaeus chinensis TaxID=139456 RepID=UPI001FB5D094|nr:metallophosphoesterase 1-like isoform X2 [Penaeus chinensis]
MKSWMMVLRRSKYILNVRLIGKVAAALASVMCYCEFLHYYVVLFQCHWPELDHELSVRDIKNDASPLHVMVLADTHLLGTRNGHWFDKLRREWQMHRAFQSSITVHNPDVVIFLGDLFDEGKWCKPSEFAEYVQRFHDLFRTPEETHVLVAVGNHDVGFHYSLNPYLVNRFEAVFATGLVALKQIKGVTFVTINSMALEGDECFLCKPASDKIKIIGHSICSEVDEAPEDIKHLLFRERWECISRDATETLFEELSPRLVLSGHTHHGCHVKHNTSKGTTVDEYTVPSFSWRNKENPTFSMLTITSNNFSIYKCQMPKENTVIAIYAFSAILLVLWIAAKIVKTRGILYTKVEGHID